MKNNEPQTEAKANHLDGFALDDHSKKSTDCNENTENSRDKCDQSETDLYQQSDDRMELKDQEPESNENTEDPKEKEDDSMTSGLEFNQDLLDQLGRPLTEEEKKGMFVRVRKISDGTMGTYNMCLVCAKVLSSSGGTLDIKEHINLVHTGSHLNLRAIVKLCHRFSSTCRTRRDGSERYNK